MTTCVVCGVPRQPNPQAEDGWRPVEAGESIYALCPRHVPSATITREQARQAMVAIYRKIYGEPIHER